MSDTTLKKNKMLEKKRKEKEKKDKQMKIYAQLQDDSYLDKLVNNDLVKKVKSKKEKFNKKIKMIKKMLPKKPGCYISVDKCPKQKSVITDEWFKDIYGEANLGSGNTSNICLFNRKKDYNNYCGINNTKTHYVPSKKPTTSGCYINIDKCPNQKGIKTNEWIRDTYGEKNLKSGDDSNICLYDRKKDYNKFCGTTNTKTHFVKKNIFNKTFDRFNDLLGYPGICEGKTLKISEFPNCALQCQRNPHCKAIIYDKTSKYCELLTNCRNKKKSNRWLYKEIKPLIDEKNILFEFPKRFKFSFKRAPLFIEILFILTIIIFIILFSYDFIYSLYNIYKVYTEK